MTFANLSPLAVIGGIAALAGILFALQWLRIRHRQQQVVTLLFWREAIDDAPVRTFWHRFRHWWAYLFILAICSLLWLALAEPESPHREGSEFTVVLLDGSAGMARHGRFDTVVEEMKEEVASLPRDQRQVIWVGGQTLTLLNPGEHELLLENRLQDMRPQAAPAGIEQQLRQLAETHRDEHKIQVLVFGDAPVRQSVLDQLPEALSVSLASSEVEFIAGNKGITALGVADSASGNWKAVDVHFQLEGDDAYVAGSGALQIDINGQPLDRAKLLSAPNDVDGAYRIIDLPANGGLLTIRLTEQDSLALDNEASIRLPVKRPIKVLLSSSLNGDLETLLSLDPAMELITDASVADVVVRRRGEVIGDALPALEFVAAEEQQQAFQLGYPEQAPADGLFMNAVHTIGLDQIDASGLADVAQRPIEVSISAGDQWSFSVWQELLTGSYNFVQTRSFPIFIANSIRWLAGSETWVPYVAAGEPMLAGATGHREKFTSANGNALITLGGDLVPAIAGNLARANGGSALAVSLLNSDVTRNDVNSALNSGASLGINLPARGNLVLWLLLAVLLLVAVEWVLYQKGRMP